MRRLLFLSLTTLLGCNVQLFDPATEYECITTSDCTDGWVCFESLDRRKTCVRSTDVSDMLLERATTRTEIECRNDAACPDRLICRPTLGHGLDCDADDGECVCVGSDAWDEIVEERLAATTSVPCAMDEECGPSMVCQVDDSGVLRCIGETAAADELAERATMREGEACTTDTDCSPLVCQADDRAQLRCISSEDARAERDARAQCGSCSLGEDCHSEPLNGEVVAFCRKACDPFTSDPVCESWEVCDVWLASPGHGVCSLPCDGDDDCSSGRICDVETGTCGCSTDEHCTDDGYRCDIQNGRCTRACKADSDCACGSLCTAGVCVAGCTSDDDCCNTSSCVDGLCTVETPEVGALGEPCSRDYHCAGTLFCTSSVGVCLESSSTEGVCTANEGCSAAARCARYVDPFGDSIYRGCLPACTTDADCAPRTHCRTTTPTGEGACIRQCTDDADCIDGVCDQAIGRCMCERDEDCQEGWGSNATCDVDGNCACTPSCNGKVCGDDGCGGSCGTCEVGLVCSETGSACETRTNFCGPEPDIECDQDRGNWCPANSTCGYENGEAVSCICNDGYVGQTCDGTPCSEADCGAMQWGCAPQ